MSSYGVSLLLTMGLGVFAWSYAFEALGNVRAAARLPLSLSAIFLILSTTAYASMLASYAPEGRGWAMIAFLTGTIQLGIIAVSGIFWAIVGQTLARKFLNAPSYLLGIALISALASLLISFYYPPNAV